MLKLRFALLLAMALMAGCGEVVVFGHTIREKKADNVVAAQAAATPQPTPASTPDSSAPVVPSTPAAPQPATNIAAAVAPATKPLLKAVTLVIAPQAGAQVAANANFSAEALLDAVKTELRSRNLLDEAGASADGSAEISIDAFAMEPTSNAIVFGYVFSDGKLAADLTVRAANGGAATQRIDAHARLSIPANGESKNPLGPLYRRFAVVIGDRLAGVESTKPDDPVNNQLYR